MFVSAAHSYRQQARLAITLAWVAGYTNIVALLACGTVTSHMTGAASNLGRGLVEGNWPLALLEIFLLGSFLAGAAVAGVTTEVAKRRGWESIYVLPMVLEALLLACFALGIELALVHQHGFHTSAQPDLSPQAGASAAPMLGPVAYVLVGLAAAAMGIQNATITRISSGVVRTTHVTGVVTDMGMELVGALESLARAARLRGTSAAGAGGVWTMRDRWASIRSNPSARRFGLLATILGSFVLGAALGTLGYRHVSMQWAMFLPVMFLAWIIAQDLRRPIAEIEPSELVARAGLDLPDWLGVYHLADDRHTERTRELRRNARARVQRLPDLVAWLERIPDSLRVIVLDLSDVHALDDDAGIQLRAALVRMKEQGRALIIAGVTPEQYRRLKKAGAGDMLTPANVCPDVELAIARGLGM